MKSGRYIVVKSTAKERYTRSLQAVNLWCKKHRHWKISDQWKHLKKVLLGHYGYYGMIGNMERISAFRYFVIRIWFKWLKRRSRLKDLNWDRFNKIIARYQLPLPRIIHSINIAKLLSEEPDALVAHVRICGGSEQVTALFYPDIFSLNLICSLHEQTVNFIKLMR